MATRAKALLRALRHAWQDPAGKQARLIVLVGANLLALITAFTMLIVNHFGDTAAHTAAIRAEQVAKAASSQLHLALTMVDQGLQRTERRVVEAEGRPTFARLRSAHQFPEQLKVNLAVVNGEGQLFMTLRSPEGIAPFDVLDREYVRPHFQGNVEGTYVGRPIVERRSGVWSIPLSRTLRADDGRFLGVAVALIDAAALGEMLHGVSLGTTDILDIVASDGTVLVRWPRRGVDPMAAIDRSVTNLPGFVASDEQIPGWPLHVEVGLNRAEIAAATRPFQFLIVAGSVAGALLVALFSALLLGKTREATAQRDEIAARQAHLLAMLDAIPADIFEFDPNDRLVLANSQGRKSFLGSIASNGETLREIMQRAIAIRRGDRPAHESDRWLEENLAFFHEGGQREERDARDAWRRSYITKLPNGGRVVLRVDITELKRRKAQLQASEARYSELVSSLPDALLTIGAHGRIRYASDASTQVLGRDPAGLIGTRLATFIVERDYATVMGALTRLRAEPDKPQTIVCETIRPDGSRRFVQITYKLQPVAAGDRHDEDQIQLTVLMRDVHEQHMMQRKLDQQAANLTSVFEATGASILLLDSEQRVTMANHAFLFLVGKTLDEVVGRKFDELAFGSIPGETFEEWRTIGAGRRLKPVEFDVDVILDEQKSRIIRVTANPATDATGALSHIVLIGVDDTDRRLAEVRLFDSSRLANLGEMASGVAHEINQPLAIIRLAAESVTEELEMVEKSDIAPPLSDFLRQKLERIASQTERASGIIRDLRTVARKPGTEALPFDLAEAVRVGADLLREQMRLDRVDFEVNLDVPGPQVLGEPGRVQQVVINLVNNARDALCDRAGRPDRGAVGRIEVRVDIDRTTNQAILTVQDDGPGIPEKVLPRLFEPFFTTKPVGKGTGLGLSISYDIVNRMGGKMTVDNRPEGGARFRIAFPIAKAMKTAA